MNNSSTRLTLLAFTVGYALSAQVAEESNRRYRDSEGREAMARGLTRPGRDAQQKPRELVAAMNLRPGMVVADVGAGPGYMVPFLSEAVGPQGRVLAEDIFDEFLSRAREDATKRNLSNVTFIKGTETDPNLPAGEVDAVLVLDSYHHFNYPEKMLANIRKGLRSGGKLVVVEYYRRPNAMKGGDAMHHIRLDKGDAVREIEAAGFRLVSEREHVKDSQYMLILESK
jgi:ubiquinone/menaquinone biosynthesis C-methylase UbiE